MAGTIKLDGATFLEKDGGNYKISNTELKLKSSGNTIVDSSGNAVLSESGGNVSVGNLRLPASGGIKDSAGNNVLIESSGTVTVDNATLGSSVSGFGLIRNVELWRLTADVTASGDITTSNIERDDTYSAGSVLAGSGMTVSSGVFSFPTTGVWYIEARGAVVSNEISLYSGLQIKTTTDNSSYNTAAVSYDSIHSASAARAALICHKIFNVTDVSTHKVKFNFDTGTNQFLQSSTSINFTTFMFMRVGD